MSSVFNHAIRWEFTDRNPITGPTKRSGVHVSAKRERTPDILDVEEMQSAAGGAWVLGKGRWCFSAMPARDFAAASWPGLKREDFDFESLHVSVTRSLGRPARGAGQNGGIAQADAD